MNGNPLPPDHITFVKTDDCEFQGTDQKGKKVYFADNAPQAFPLTYGSFRHGYTDWKYDKGKRTFRWFVYMYVLIEGEVWVARTDAIAPPESWRERMFAEKGIVVSPTGQIIK